MLNLIRADIKYDVLVRPPPSKCKDLAVILNDAYKSSNHTIKMLAEIVGVPRTEAEHWFRHDRYFSAPSPSAWRVLKNLYCINGWDDKVEMASKPNRFEMSVCISLK